MLTINLHLVKQISMNVDTVLGRGTLHLCRSLWEENLRPIHPFQLHHLLFSYKYCVPTGYAVARLVEALRYKSEVAGSIPNCVNGIFH
jgi:hypothetical protein